MFMVGIKNLCGWLRGESGRRVERERREGKGTKKVNA
jgi:hypothetical protein